MQLEMPSNAPNVFKGVNSFSPLAQWGIDIKHDIQIRSVRNVSHVKCKRCFTRQTYKSL